MKEEKVKSYQKKTQRDYSLAFKLQIVDEVEKGHYTYKQAQIHYGIQGRSTVLTWLRKHGRLNWKDSEAMKDSPAKRIKELERKLQRLQDEKEVLNRAIDIADSTLGTDIRKKYLSLLLKATPDQAQESNDLPLDL